ncbi:MAG: histidine phosphatase family protein [Deltaproteobacteria bacterium]|nr:histidine phosphatase family protein [Deltaproteobacteria bacterium]
MEQAQLIVVRHGETEWNLEGRRQGHLDSPLTAMGRAQGEALAQRLAKYKFSSLYSSDLGRAYQTAKLISESTGHTIVVDQRLRERNLGIFQGLKGDEIHKAYPEELLLHKTGGPDYIIPQGESARQQAQRNISCLEEFAKKHTGEVIVIVTHGGVLNALFRHILSIPLEAPRRFEFMNASINIFSCGKGNWMLQTWGEISHLQPVETPGESDFYI